eukprot:TRINITY_DN6616_c0_g1_i2.p1 TRINITY_DN6616_c0_g1~~TRINITY_DN6616_c0_g1_i2.p1  ORF type:complete len:106 (-),score=26.63 TRINITY_DN6616_c0_g1_i2:152-469(-)
MEALGVPLFGINLSVALSLSSSIPGLRSSLATSLLGRLPFGAAAVVGVTSIEEARAMKEAGASAIVLKRGGLQGLFSSSPAEARRRHRQCQQVLEGLRDAMTGDD